MKKPLSIVTVMFFLVILLPAFLVTERARAYPPALSRPENEDQSEIKKLDQLNKLPGGLAALPPVPVPQDNPQTEAKIELGKMLFFDKRLSLDNTISCATCHNSANGYGDGIAL